MSSEHQKEPSDNNKDIADQWSRYRSTSWLLLVSSWLTNCVGFYQMTKIVVTPTIVLAEFIFFKKTISSKKVLALAAVSAGVAVATVSDLEFNLFGAIVAVKEKLTSFDFFSLLLLSPNPTHRYSGKMAKLN
ncbi:hypothetical protein KIW84_032891 [Lathyrus oleraceus]|uniref:Sugar phosphate transporter domain-containing protein n=1 Tax=Pisum sativum TaxID=3888 RepID=A0A9D4XX00_PEA|nr:hypothetical protein KIW84_032891 [Pisum sativum]